MSLLKKLFVKKEEHVGAEIQETPVKESKIEPAQPIIEEPIEVNSSMRIYEVPETDAEWDGSDSEQAIAVKEALSKYVESY